MKTAREIEVDVMIMLLLAAKERIATNQNEFVCYALQFAAATFPEYNWEYLYACRRRLKQWIETQLENRATYTSWLVHCRGVSSDEIFADVAKQIASRCAWIDAMIEELRK